MRGLGELDSTTSRTIAPKQIIADTVGVTLPPASAPCPRASIHCSPNISSHVSASRAKLEIAP
eukprot:5358094-Pleurochrysis_carterae.AAC.2